MNNNVTAIVVTYNRRELLMRCIQALRSQTAPPHTTLIIDNASTDGTHNLFNSDSVLKDEGILYIRLEDNLGGAGGFANGIREALLKSPDWFWLMDDDAEPHPDALEHLMKIADDPTNVYGSLAVNGNDTSWTTTLFDPTTRIANKIIDVPPRARVQSLPFLGFLIHRSLVEKIGFPDADYFIAADDVEYCVRAKRAGAAIIIAGKSRIEHPKTQFYMICLLGRNLIYLRLPPWKRYYDTRNRLLIARKHYGVRLLTQTIPGSFVRLLAALLYEPRKLAQLWSFSAGMIDGLLGRKGRRHTNWRISQ